MDLQNEHPLVILMLEMERASNPAQSGQDIRDRLLKSPRGRKQLEEQKKLWVSAMLEQSYECQYATLTVRRNGDKINIGWEYKECVETPCEWLAFGAFREIEYIPDEFGPPFCAFHQKMGNGQMQWTVPEGQCYTGIFIFHHVIAHQQGKDAPISSIYFNVAVPMSQRKRIALAKAGNGSTAASDDISSKLAEFIEKRDSYERIMREHICIIKSKGLPKEEEQREIADLQDYGVWIKEKEGI